MSKQFAALMKLTPEERKQLQRARLSNPIGLQQECNRLQQQSADLLERLDKAQAQLKQYETLIVESVEFAEGVLQVCEFLDNSDHHYTKHTEAFLAKLKGDKCTQSST